MFQTGGCHLAKWVLPSADTDLQITPDYIEFTYINRYALKNQINYLGLVKFFVSIRARMGATSLWVVGCGSLFHLLIG